MKNDISSLIVNRIHDIYTVKAPRDTETDGTLKHAAFIIRRTGASSYRVDKELYMADVNHVLFLPAGTSYHMEVEKVGVCHVMELDVSETASAVGVTSLYTEGNDVLTAIKNMSHYWTLKGPAYHAKCMSELYGMLTHLSTVNSYSLTLAGKYGMIHRSVKYIETHYADPELYTPQLADMSGMGETYYRNIFIAVFGVPPTKYIQQYRIEKAKELLVGTALSVDEIAARTGFAGASYFCKVFKSLVGQTPSDFAACRKLLG
ncbi:MAG: helix-turn-helix transcriptional regulator [Ruminococcaceae bacterium]|nr:helix-turn-helix transcriptional regulator [Oscillospiraceae bacterium]